MAYDFSPLNKKIDEIKDWLANEFLHVRTGRATPSILDSVRVSSYGSLSPIQHVAGVTVEDAKTILVTPWDKEHIRAIEAAVINAGLGLSVSTTDRGVRVIFPELTAERRTALQKVVKAKHEEARVSLRKARDESWEEIQAKEKSGEIGEDDKFRLKEEMQKLIDTANATFDDMVGKKEKDLSF